MYNVKILGSGSYLPKNKVTSEELDKRLGLQIGTSKKISHVNERYYVKDETAIDMAFFAVEKALNDANIKKEDIDLIVSASGVYHQPIPCNASLLQEKLGLTKVPCFDVNTTCLSFLSALEVVSPLIHIGKYKNVLVFSADIASVGIDYNDLKSCLLFGDGASAFILSKSDCDSQVISSYFETHSEGVHSTEIIGGGNHIHSRECAKRPNDFLFSMKGRDIAELTFKKLPNFFEKCFGGKSVVEFCSNVDLIIPHQSSDKALRYSQVLFGFPEEKFVNEIEKYGNMISASIPFLLDKSIKENRIKRGDNILLLGTGAGLSLGMVYLKY